MKSLVTILCLMMAFVACNQAPEAVKVGEATLRLETEEKYNLIYQDMLEGQKNLELENGVGSLNVEGKQEVGFFAQGGMITFFVQPGDDIKLSLVEAKPVVETASAAYNEYLSAKLEIMKKSTQGTQARMKMQSADYLAAENAIQASLDSLLSAHSSDISKAIVTAEKSSNALIKAASMMQYPSYYAYLNGGEVVDNNLKDELKAFIGSDEVKDVNNPNYVEILLELAQADAVTSYLKEGEEMTLEKYVDFLIVASIEYIDDAEVKNAALAKSIATIIELDMAAAKKAFDDNKGSINADYTQKLDGLFENWAALMPGNMAPDFTTVDLDGNEKKLSDFRGKYVYIDVWATWCGPCIQEIPYLKEMNKTFEGQELVILSVSIDDTQEPWKKMVADDGLTGTHLYIDGAWGSSLVKDYKIAGIPRFMLVDPEGKIVTVQAERPSGNINETLTNLLAS